MRFSATAYLSILARLAGLPVCMILNDDFASTVTAALQRRRFS